jgi:uncharacterized BrkB/YihY/UPF0761 family membrane protein
VTDSFGPTAHALARPRDPNNLRLLPATHVRRARRSAPGARRLLAAASRALHARVLHLTAAGLAYSTLLWLVALLVVAVLLTTVAAPYRVREVLAVALARVGLPAANVIEHAVPLVFHRAGALLGVMLAVASLLYATLGLLDRLSDAVNHVWRVHRAHGLGRRSGPALTMVAAGSSLLAGALAFVWGATPWFLSANPAVTGGSLGSVAIGHFVSLAFLATGFFLVYRFVPDTAVSTPSALLAATVAAALWQVVAAMTVSALSLPGANVPGWPAILVVPIALHLGWLAALVGGEVGRAHQQARSSSVAGTAHDRRYREWIAVAVAAEATRRVLGTESPARLEAMARLIDAPLADVETIVGTLVARGILVRRTANVVTLAHSPDELTVGALLDAVPTRSSSEASRRGHGGRRRPDGAIRDAITGTTLRGLVGSPGG